MDFSRRTDERRRRVMLSTGAGSVAAPTASSRKRIEELREARRPSMAYGSRVRRCLRGRWFSLVPVTPAAYAKSLLAIAGIVFLLIVLHDASVRYEWVAGRQTWVDVLRINRYGSLGRYVIGLLYLAVAGAAWLVYQLRRYRNDDFSGNYQLWQWILGTSLVASFASTVPLTEMAGVGIEWFLGKRIALSGEDWIELFLMVGGAILALRTIAEMWHYRFAAVLMVGGWVMIAIPIAAQWNVIAVEEVNRWTIVTSAPLVAVALWFAATVGYLRCLFREVRGIQPAPGFIERFRLIARPDSGDSEEPLEDSALPVTRPKPIQTEAPAQTKPVAQPKPATQPKPVAQPTKRDTDSDDDEQDRDQAKRSWMSFFRRKPKLVSADSSPSKDVKDSSKVVAAKTPPKESHPIKSQSDTNRDTAAGSEHDASSEPPAKKRRFGLGSIMKRRQADEAEDDEPKKPVHAQSAASQPSHDDEDDTDDDDSNNDDGSDDGDLSEDGIDWSNMSKAERRRMRKQLKRGGRAA
ncbi:hypothetical protein [Neorhodopirellula pilleata]|uniref:Transmembrane protein n=1 Tax=Neorhodopirellula pilleata TaxID=2714738 RepID=A0A5C6AEK7_9BACT|nr:hypothetical protein [Neorhodopirellula pilleata]TWT97501.1 hypothetical protein Pla100_26550 [Neorhodopirellula pilleata]